MKFQGVGTEYQVPHKRNMSEDGIQIFLDIDEKTWRNYQEKPGFIRVTEKVKKIIRTHKMDGAIIGQSKENIVARELGLTDKQEVTSKAGGIKIVRRNHSEANARD